MTQPATKNLLGDRDMEWGWVFAHLPQPSREHATALDFGPGKSFVALVLAMKGYRVTTVDLEARERSYVHPRIHSIVGDLLAIDVHGTFDLIINCSTIEHVGLAGRYGTNVEQPDGDLAAMAKLRDLLRPGGVMIVTIPVGRDAVFAPMCRVYGPQRLPRLIEGFTIQREAYWVKDEANRWVECDRATALAFEAYAADPDPLRNCYGLAGLVLTVG